MNIDIRANGTVKEFLKDLRIATAMTMRASMSIINEFSMEISNSFINNISIDIATTVDQ